jgi:hypothetical protein
MAGSAASHRSTAGTWAVVDVSLIGFIHRLKRNFAIREIVGA